MCKHPSHLGMQLEDPVVCTYVSLSFTALHIKVLIVPLSQFNPSVAAVLVVSLFHTGVCRAQPPKQHRQRTRQSGVEKTGQQTPCMCTPSMHYKMTFSFRTFPHAYIYSAASPQVGRFLQSFLTHKANGFSNTAEGFFQRHRRPNMYTLSWK